jgi:PQQ-like domain
MERWNPCEKVFNIHNVGNLTLKWSYTIGNQMDSSPAVANGVVYVGSWDNKNCSRTNFILRKRKRRSPI